MSQLHWLKIDPIDTLFFRGSEPMEAGESHKVDTMFPPVPSTLTGAIRSAILSQNNITPEKEESWPAILGTPETPGFELIGPLFMVGTEPLLPVPATWYTDHGDDFSGKKQQVQNSTPLQLSNYSFKSSVAKPFWLKNPKGKDMKPLLGYWATKQTFSAVKKGKTIIFQDDPSKIIPGQATIIPASALCVREPRVGIALTNQRTAKDGHLYSTVHIRLRPEVKIIASINSKHDTLLKQEGILQLGGEQRICHYQFDKSISLPKHNKSEYFLALAPVALATLPDSLINCPRASGKLLRFGGWDMKKKFHKPMTAWLPAGTVFQAGDNGLPPTYLAI